MYPSLILRIKSMVLEINGGPLNWAHYIFKILEALFTFGILCDVLTVVTWFKHFISMLCLKNDHHFIMAFELQMIKRSML